MTEGRCNGDAVKHLVTKCFPNAIRHGAAGECNKWPDEQPTGANLCVRVPECLYAM